MTETEGVAQADRAWMQQAIDLSQLCPPSASAYSVGAIVVGSDGNELARGYSRESDPHVHAEEAALAKLDEELDLAQATIYSTLEPCTQRRSRPHSCTELILAAGIRRVVIAWREPSLFVADCVGVETLATAGVKVAELTEFAAAARSVNSHLIPESMAAGQEGPVAE